MCNPLHVIIIAYILQFQLYVKKNTAFYPIKISKTLIIIKRTESYQINMLVFIMCIIIIIIL